VALAAVALSAAGCGFGSGTKTVTVSRTQTVTTTQTITSKSATADPCTGAELAGNFALVPGSAGAGQIEYALTVTNTSEGPCFVRGVPKATLLGASAVALPTHITAAGDGGTGRIVLQPGASAVAHARFSPDVAGDGDSQTGACQPQAQMLQVNPDGGGATDAAIKPPTSVCQRGTLNFERFGYAG
jgi:hypothetical protein